MEANAKNAEQYRKELEKWSSGEGEYKGKSYYAFKDMSFEKWSKDPAYKVEQDSWNEMRSIIETAVSKNPISSKKYYELPQYSYESDAGQLIEQNYGTSITNMIMTNIRSESVKKNQY